MRAGVVVAGRVLQFNSHCNKKIESRLKAGFFIEETKVSRRFVPPRRDESAAYLLRAVSGSMGGVSGVTGAGILDFPGLAGGGGGISPGLDFSISIFGGGMAFRFCQRVAVAAVEATGCRSYRAVFRFMVML
jgi:hypothetical protein